MDRGKFLISSINCVTPARQRRPAPVTKLSQPRAWISLKRVSVTHQSKWHRVFFFSLQINNIQKYYLVSLYIISIIIVFAPSILRRFNTWNLHKRNQMRLLISTSPFALKEPTSKGGKERAFSTWVFSKWSTSSLTRILQRFLLMRWVRKNFVSIKKK